MSGRMRILVLVCGVAFGLPCAAQVCKLPTAQEPEADYKLTLSRVANSDCLGDATRDPNVTTVAFMSKVNLFGTSIDTKPVVDAMDIAIADASGGVARGLDPLWAPLRQELETLRGSLTAPTADLDQWRQSAATAVGSGNWVRFRAGGTNQLTLAGAGVDFRTVPESCQNTKPCPAFQERIGQIRVINLMASLSQAIERKDFDAYLAERTLRAAQWDAYRDKSHSMYFWEVALNGALIMPRYCDEQGGLQIGFCRVPDRQLIVFHPEGAVRFSRTATKANELKPALLIELLGWYRWDWARAGGKETAEVSNRWGASLVATFTDSEREKSWGYGPILHFGDYSLAITKAGGGGRWSAVINLKLGERYFAKRDEAVQYLKGPKKPSLSEVL